jgi:hypothetical protein
VAAALRSGEQEQQHVETKACLVERITKPETRRYLRGMLRIVPGIIVGLVLLLATGCEKKENEDLVNPFIEFRSDSGYTYQNDTAGLQDTLLVGVKVTEGSEDLRSFKVAVFYDGSAVGETLDSVPYTGSPFTYSRILITRDQAGTERFAFSVLDENGDWINRNLVLTVQ